MINMTGEIQTNSAKDLGKSFGGYGLKFGNLEQFFQRPKQLGVLCIAVVSG